MRLWMTAVSALPHTDDVSWSVVDTLLQMASWGDLRPHIPVSAWDWLKKRPILHPGSLGLIFGTEDTVVQMITELRDTELITSYLFVVWSEWNLIDPVCYTAILRLIRKELCGIGAAGYRIDLIQRLNHVMSQLDLGWEHIHHHSSWILEAEIPRMMQGYGKFKEALLEVDEEAMEVLTGMLGRIVPLFAY